VKKIRKPAGRIGEEVARLTDDERGRAAVRHGHRIGDDSTLQIWNCRKAMARTIRMQEKSAPRSDWSPVVKLSDGEGY
jgi:hypothetical protein